MKPLRQLIVSTQVAMHCLPYRMVKLQTYCSFALGRYNALRRNATLLRGAQLVTSLRYSIPLLFLILALAACTPAAPAAPAAQNVSPESAAPTSQPSPTAQPASEATSQPTATAQPVSEAASQPTAAAQPPSRADGATEVRLTEESEARYRIREQLANLPAPNDAVGVTTEVSGSVFLNADSSLDTAQTSQITVGLASLKSDEGRRDRYVRNNTLQTSQFPNTVFTVKEFQGLPIPLPTSGEHSFKMIGDLKIKDVSHAVTWDVTAAFTEESIDGMATTSIAFADFKMEKPSVSIVLSVQDTFTLEIDFKATVG